MEMAWNFILAQVYEPCNDLECKSSRFAAVVRRSVADRQLHLNGIIRSAGVAKWQELGPKA